MPVYHKICANPECGKEFIATKKHARACSGACRAKLSRLNAEYQRYIKKLFDKVALQILSVPEHERVSYYGKNCFRVTDAGISIKEPYPKEVKTKKYVFQYNDGGYYSFEKRSK